MSVIKINKLSKRYAGSDTYALKELSLSVEQGEVYGFLGPNGSGKSTTIRLLMNFIQPTSGSAQILGMDVIKDGVKLKGSIGYLSGDAPLYPKMTGEQFLNYMSSILPADSHKYVKELASNLQINLRKQIGSLSKGNRQKVALIQAFMSKPQVLILDEPTSGLDPLMQEVFNQMVLEAKSRGATIFLSSHVLSEVQKICDRICIIKDGSLVAEKSIKELTTDASQSFLVKFKKSSKASQTIQKELTKLKGVTKVSKRPDSTFEIWVKGSLSGLLTYLAKNEPESLETHELDLETEFMHYYSDSSPKKGGKL